MFTAVRHFKLLYLRYFYDLLGYNRRDDQGSGGTERSEGGYSSGNNYSRGGYRNNRGGFNNDYYNRRQEGRVSTVMILSSYIFLTKLRL